ncbi:glycoside hydrolase family 2 protein, partial [Planctomycetota bacterium]
MEWTPDPNHPLTRVCTKCGEEKHLMEFYLDYRTGRRIAQCKDCRRAYSRRYHAANAARCRAQNRAWKAANRERHRESARRWRRRHRERYPRRKAVRGASYGLWKLGLLDVGDRCEDCGSREIELHHPDYADPFRVVPLCHACHMARHFAVWRRDGGGPVKYPEEYREAAASCLLVPLALSSKARRREPMKARRIVLCLLAVASAAVAAARLEVSLSGQWEHQKVAELKAPPKGGEWKPCTVPGYLRGTDYERVWFRRSFTVPKAMRGQRLKIRFGGVKYNSRVLVNGKHVGGCFGGYRPFEVDITDAARVGQANELLVGLHDWTGIFTPGKIDLGPTKEWNRLRGRPSDKILAPIGGLYGLYGIWDDVTLVAHPPVYIKDLFVKTSVRKKELAVEYTVANELPADAQVSVTAAVEEGAGSFTHLRESENRPRDPVPRVVLRLPVAPVRVPAGGTATVSAKAAWPKPRVDPHLYRLQTELNSGDFVSTRFGFREFWVEGHRFYLNGVPINLLATSWWPPHAPMTREQVEERWRAIKKAGCVAFRTHTQPWRPVHYDVADELGLLMIIEGAVWNDDSVYRVKDPVFWDNYAKHLKAMVDRDKNRPSLVMWSLENEMTGGRMNDRTPYAKGQLVRMGKLVRQWDPTRPIFYESDGDPDGVADAIGIHYPHEYPHYTCWPNEAYWLDKPWKGHGGGGFFLNGEPHFLWKKDKPLYIGEF